MLGAKLNLLTILFLSKTSYTVMFFIPYSSWFDKKYRPHRSSKNPGVRYIFTYKDIPGENQVGGIIQDEELFAEHKVEFVGQPIALVVAENFLTAKKASQKIKIEFEELEPIFNPREAFEKGLLIMPPRIFLLAMSKKLGQCAITLLKVRLKQVHKSICI